MTRPVRGFLTKDGKFFSTKLEGQMYEATTDFNEAMQKHFEDAGLTYSVLEFIMDKTREFVLINRDAVKAYITLIKTMPEVNEHDIREILLQPRIDTAPVAAEDEPQEATYTEVDDAFVQALVGRPMEPPNGSPEDDRGHENDRQLGEGE